VADSLREEVMFTFSASRRFALTAVLALGLGGISAVTSQAAGTPVNLITSPTSITPAGITATQLAGPANFVTIKNTVVTTQQARFVFFTVNGGTTVGGATSGVISVGGNVQITCSHVGTITVLGYAIINGAATTSPTDTITITVVSSLPGTVYASSLVLAAPGTTQPTAATDAAFSITQPAGTAKVANFTVAELDAAGIAMLPAKAKPVTVTVTNGLISSPNLAATGSGGSTYLYGTPIHTITDFVLSGINGLGGASVVTIAVNGAKVKTYSVTFTGLASKIVLTPINSVVGIGNATAILPTSTAPIGITANVNALEVQEFDAAGHLLVINPGNIRISSSVPAVAIGGAVDIANRFSLGNISGGTATSGTVAGVSINGISAGTTTFTATDISQLLSSAPAGIRVSNAIPTSVVLSTNLPTYAPGAVGTLRTTLSNSSGTMPAGTYIVFTGQATSSIVLAAGSALLPGAPVAVTTPPVQKVGQVTVNNSGVYAFSFNAPSANATITITGVAATPSIQVTPAIFVVGTVPDVATAESLSEATSAQNVDTEVATFIVTATNAMDAAVQDAATKSAVALASVSHLTIVVKAVLAKALALAKITKLILLKLRRK
jgi:hypothetical protein